MNDNFRVNMLWLILSAGIILTASSSPGRALEADLYLSTAEVATSDITFSKSLPKQGEMIEIRARIHNKGEKPASSVEVKFFQEDREKEIILLGTETVKKVSPGSSALARHKWQTPGNGFYNIVVIIDPQEKVSDDDRSNNRASVEVPVVNRDLYFHFWNIPRSNRYIQSIMADKKEDQEYWLNRGVIPCRGASGYQHASHTEDEFFRGWSGDPEWGSSPGLVIDEFGGADDGIDKRMARALVRTRKKRPDLYIAVWDAWGILNDTLAESYVKAADLVINEQYRDYFGEYFFFDEAWKIIQKQGLVDRAVIGISPYPNLWITTEQELRSQIRYIRKLAPEMPGVSFFGSPRPHLAEPIDRAIRDYHLMPVLFVKKMSGETATISNIGGMDAKEIELRFYTGDKSEQLGTLTLDLKAGEAKPVKLPPWTKHVEFVPRDDYTILDADVRVGLDKKYDAEFTMEEEISERFSSDPGLTILRDKKENNQISGAYYSIPEMNERTVIVEFDITIAQTRMYGATSFALASGKTGAEMRTRFQRHEGDRDIDDSQVRAKFSFKDDEGVLIRTVAERTLDQKKTHHVVMIYKPDDYVRLVVGKKRATKAGDFWDSGKLKILGKASFDRVIFGVRPDPGSEVKYDRKEKNISLRGGASSYVQISAIDNLKIRYGQGSANKP